MEEVKPSGLRVAPITVKRPTGEPMLIGGWCTLAGGILAIVISLGASSFQTAWSFQAIGAGLVSLSVALLLTGSIIRALSFIPGVTAKTEKECPQCRETTSAGTRICPSCAHNF